MADAELQKRIRRILEIRDELRHLYAKTHPGVTIGEIGWYALSGGLTVVGLALAVPSGGLSLLLSAAGMVIFLVDIARVIQHTAETEELQRRARDLEQELKDHLEFIRRFGRR